MERPRATARVAPTGNGLGVTLHANKKTLSDGCQRAVLLSNLAYSCFWALILTPGPMVEAVTQERIYWPLAVAGLALMMAVIRAE